MSTQTKYTYMHYFLKKNQWKKSDCQVNTSGNTAVLNLFFVPLNEVDMAGCMDTDNIYK